MNPARVGTLVLPLLGTVWHNTETMFHRPAKMTHATYPVVATWIFFFVSFFAIAFSQRVAFGVFSSPCSHLFRASPHEVAFAACTSIPPPPSFVASTGHWRGTHSALPPPSRRVRWRVRSASSFFQICLRSATDSTVAPLPQPQPHHCHPPPCLFVWTAWGARSRRYVGRQPVELPVTPSAASTAAGARLAPPPPLFFLPPPFSSSLVRVVAVYSPASRVPPAGELSLVVFARPQQRGCRTIRALFASCFLSEPPSPARTHRTLACKPPPPTQAFGFRVCRSFSLPPPPLVAVLFASHVATSKIRCFYKKNVKQKKIFFDDAEFRERDTT